MVITEAICNKKLLNCREYECEEISSKVNRHFFVLVYRINENRRHFGLRRREKMACAGGELIAMILAFLQLHHTRFKLINLQELRLCKIITINSRFFSSYMKLWLVSYSWVNHLRGFVCRYYNDNNLFFKHTFLSDFELCNK